MHSYSSIRTDLQNLTIKEGNMASLKSASSSSSKSAAGSSSNNSSSSTANFRPLGDRVAVERVEEKTSSGIIIPDTAKEKPVQGKIIAVGEGARDDQGKRIALDVKVGDIVLFTKWGGTEFKIDGREITIMKESDILAILGKSSSVKAA